LGFPGNGRNSGNSRSSVFETRLFDRKVENEKEDTTKDLKIFLSLFGMRNFLVKLSKFLDGLHYFLQGKFFLLYKVQMLSFFPAGTLLVLVLASFF
jgi:hypothetical protein